MLVKVKGLKESITAGSFSVMSDVSDMADNEIRYGIWKDGHKLKWLEAEEVEEINHQNQLLREAEVKNNHPRANRDRMSFDPPAGFDEEAERVQLAIDSIASKQLGGTS
jgi:hypothetical protein